MPGGLTVLLHLIRFLFTEMLQSEATSHLGCASRNRSALAGFSIHGAASIHKMSIYSGFASGCEVRFAPT
jgi:hypothetical protein